MPVGGIQGLNSNIFTQAIKNLDNIEQKIIPNGQTINEQEKNENTKTNFEEVLDTVKGGIYKVNDVHMNANNNIQSFIKGEDVSMHEIMLSVQEAQMSTQLMLEVRNKIYEAYQEVNRVQL